MCYFLFPTLPLSVFFWALSNTQERRVKEGNCVVHKYAVQMCILVHCIVALRAYMRVYIKRTAQFSCVTIQVSVKDTELHVSHSLTFDKVLPYTKSSSMLCARAGQICGAKKEPTMYRYRTDCQLSNNMHCNTLFSSIKIITRIAEKFQ